MSNSEYTKEQLIKKLDEAQQQIAELEAEVTRQESEQRQVQETLINERDLLQTVLDNIPAHIYVKDTMGRLIIANADCMRFWGWTSPEDYLGKTDHDFQPPEKADLLRMEEQIVLQSGQALIQIEREDYADQWLSVTKVPFRDEQGNIIGLVGFNLNITRRKNIEAKAKQAEILEIELEKEKKLVALKDRFISTVSHEFRTPLAVIRTCNHLVMHYADRISIERQQQAFEQINQQIEKLTELIDDVLALGQTQAGKMDFNPSLIDLGAFCLTIFDQVQFTDTSEHQFEFINNAPPEPVMIDGKLLQHILTNLLTNAVKYSPQKSHITFELNYDKHNIIIEISDEGIGIPEEDIVYLFEPFHRSSNVGAIKGTGIGLSIVREYVILHGGSIEVESEVDRGSTFRILLPIIYSRLT